MRRSSSEMWNADVEAESSNEVADDMVVKVSDIIIDFNLMMG